MMIQKESFFNKTGIMDTGLIALHF